MQICGVFFAGYYFSKYNIGNMLVGLKRLAGFVFPCIIVIVMCMLGYRGNLQSIELAHNNVISTTLIAILSSISIFCISSLLSKNKTAKSVLTYIGNQSFSIMALHFLAFKVVSEAYIILVSPDAHLYSFPTIITNSFLWISFYIVAGTLLPLCLSRLYKQTLSKLT